MNDRYEASRTWSRSGHKGRTPQRLSALAAILGILALSGPASAAVDVSDRAPAVSPGSSRARVLISELEGLDSVSVTAQTSEGHVEGTTLGSPVVCVSAKTSELGTTTTGESETTTKVVREIFGCAEPIADYGFDPLGWDAHAKATIESMLYTYKYELRDDEWVFVGFGPDEEVASTVVDLTWTGSGEPRISPWISPIPYICYAPPFVCGVGAGAHVAKEATVEGTVDVRAFDASVSVPAGQAGSLAWWL